MRVNKGLSNALDNHSTQSYLKRTLAAEKCEFLTANVHEEVDKDRLLPKATTTKCTPNIITALVPTILYHITVA